MSASTRAVEAEIKLGDQFEGLMLTTVDVDRLSFTDLAGTLVSVSVQSKDGLLPTLRLWDVASSQFIDITSFVTGTGTSKVRLQNFPLPETGDYQIVIGGTGTFPSTYKATTKRKDAKENKKIVVEDDLANASATHEQEFDALGGSTLNVTVQSTSEERWNPTIDLLEDPNQNPIDLTGLLVESDGKAQLKKLVLPATDGTYTLRVASRDGGFGTFKLTISVKAPKSKQKLQEAGSPRIDAVEGTGFETGVIRIEFTLFSFLPGTADVNAFYEDPNNPGTFLPASVTLITPTGGPSLPGLATSREGTPHAIEWHVREDLGAIRVTDMVFRLEVVGGGSDDSSPFTVDTRGTFVEVGPGLTSARVFHSSDLLPDGRMLVAGGQGAHQGGSHEIGDFSAGGASATFTETANSLATPRQQHTSVRLPASAGNRIVLVGGRAPQASGAPLTSSEYFDPTAGTFTATAANVHSRLFSASEGMADDRVATFGNNETGAGAENDTVEVLDATQNIWTHINDEMDAGRTGASATRLADGRILIAGGSGVASTPAEIFDPTALTFTPVGAMATERAFHGAMRLVDGRVLIVGGLDTAGNPTATAEIFDPTANTFSAAGENMEIARAAFPLARLADGRVLIAGGRTDSAGAVTALSEFFRPGTNDFTPAGPMAIARQSHTMDALPDGRIVVVGGATADPGAVAVNSVEMRLPENGLDDHAPSISSITNPGASTGNVTLSYILVDDEDQDAEIAVRWRVTGGLWRQATSGTGGDGFSSLSASAAGTAHTFVWNSLADTGTSFAQTVEVEITPFGAVPGTGSTTTPMG